MITGFAQLKELLHNSSPRTAVVAAAHDVHTLEAVFAAQDDGLIDPIFVGNKTEILEFAKELNHPLSPGAGIVEQVLNNTERYRVDSLCIRLPWPGEFDPVGTGSDADQRYASNRNPFEGCGQ